MPATARRSGTKSVGSSTMQEIQCAGCEATFNYNPARPNKKYHSLACKAENRTTVSANGARAQQAADHDVEFIAVDGEGVTRVEYVETWNDEMQDFVMMQQKVHHYVLLSVGDQSLHHNGEPLRHDEIFEFLYAQKLEHPNAAFVGFFLGYDFAQWLKSLPASRGDSLFHPYGIEIGRAHV